MPALIPKGFLKNIINSKQLKNKSLGDILNPEMPIKNPYPTLTVVKKPTTE